jgi:BASS family bile acid:Na+ symporter
VTELLSNLLNIAVLVFSVTSMLSVGFSYTLREIIAPLRDVRGVLLGLAANFVLVPLLAYVVAGLLSLEPAAKTGLILVATAAGAPFLIKLTQIADGDTAFASGLLVLLLVTTIVYMPLVVPLVASEAEVSAMAIAMPLILTMLLPLGVGLVADTWLEPLTDRMLPAMNAVSSVALVVLVTATFLVNFRTILSVFGTGAILAALLVIAGAFAVGYLLGGPGAGERREVIALGTAQRNIAAATVVATQSFDSPDTLVMVVVTSIVSMAVLFPVAQLMGKRKERRAETHRGRVAAPPKAPLV